MSISRGRDLIVLKELNEGKFSHAEKLHTFILDILKEAELEMKDLDAISISKGPGSYTGLLRQYALQLKRSHLLNQQ